MRILKLNFRNRIFLLFSSLIVVAIAIIIIVVSFQVKQKMKATLVHDLHRIRTVLQEYQTARFTLLQTKGNFLSQEPRLKAAVETHDPETVSREATKLLPIVETDFFIVTDQRAAILSCLGKLQLKQKQVVDFPAILQALNFQQSITLQSIQDLEVLIIATPITVMDQFGRNILLGTISIGLIIDVNLMKQLKNLTGCEVGFFEPNRSYNRSIFSLNAAMKKSFLNSLHETPLNHDPFQSSQVHELRIQNEKYLVLGASFSKEFDQQNLLLIKSLDQALTPVLVPTQSILLIIGLLALAITLALSYFLSKGISSPVTRLVQAIQQVSQGNLDNPVTSQGTDEISRLAESFEQMRLSLKKNLAELEKTYSRLVQSEKLATTGKLLAQLSHEINNPIHNIQSALETAQKKCSDAEKAVPFVHIAHEEIMRLSRLVRQMLDFYRPGSGERTPIDVNEILEELITLSGKNFQKHRIHIYKKLLPDLPKINANRDQLKQVFLNITLNAKEAMPNGGELFIETKTASQKIEVEIRDSGSGIPTENLSKIFDAFFTTKSQISGVGLGLSVSYEIIRQHGGQILAESEVNKGTRFIVQLPMKNSG